MSRQNLSIDDLTTGHTATLSGDLKYRYTLTRRFKRAEKLEMPLIWVMLNPSTADAEINDPTIRRCIGFAYDLGFDGIEVLNLFGLRATDPKELYKAEDPIGIFNDAAIRGTIKQYKNPNVICAWGSYGKFMNRGPDVIKMLKEDIEFVFALKLNSDGSPAHPLYLPKGLAPITI